MSEDKDEQAKTDGFYLPQADRDLITDLAAIAYRYNRSAALRAIIADYRQRQSTVQAAATAQ